MTLESDVLRELLRQAGNHLWQSTIFATAAFLLALALRSTHARARHWILLVASLKFLMPFALLARLGDVLGSRVVPAAPSARLPLAVGQVVQPFTLPEPFSPTLMAPAAYEVAFPIHAVVFAVWLFGCAAVVLHWWIRWRRVRTVMHQAVPLRKGREVDALHRVRSNGVLRLPDVRLVSSTARMAPGIFGILRPVLWLPEGIADHLSETELEAILVHELCHARRRDNLAAAFHMVVAAVFWFHPLVWWLGTRMAEERERACDEQVVQLSGEPQAYAEGILKVCEFCVAQPLACAASITGADLRKRIEGIMTSRFIRELGLWKKVLLASLLVAVVICPVLLGVFKAEAQSDHKLEFEVTSVRPTAQPDLRTARRLGTPFRVGTRIYGDRVEYISMSQRQLIAEAYQVRLFQIVADPGKLSRERFDVVCKMPAGSRKEDAPRMLQSLLAERFELAVHRENRKEDVWALVVDKGGPEFRESASKVVRNPGDKKGTLPEGAIPYVAKTKDGKTILSGAHGITFLRTTLDFTSSSSHIEANRMTMPYLADLVSRTTFANDFPVVDMTGLKGEYDVAFDFPFSATGAAAKPSGGPSANSQDPVPAETASDPGSAGVLRSMRNLGLNLEKRRMSISHIVVDHVEKTPTEN